MQSQSDSATTCEKCGVIITSGMWAFCPHPIMEGHAMIERDEIPGGVTVENYGPNPITFYSHSERRRYMKAHGLEEREKFSPMPGTDIDPQGIPNPKGYMDKQTMENARILLSRQAEPKQKEWDGVEAGVLKDIQVGTMTERDAAAIAGGDRRRQSRFARRTENHGG